MSDTLDILHLSKKERKKKSILAIKNGCRVNDEIAELAWAVVRQAILDIGWTEKTRSKRLDGSFQYMVDRTHDSRRNIKQGGLDFWLDIIEINKGFFIKILQHYKLI